MAVHHIHVDAIRATTLNLCYLLSQPGEIGGENRRGDFDGFLLHCFRSPVVLVLVSCWKRRRCSEWLHPAQHYTPPGIVRPRALPPAPARSSPPSRGSCAAGCCLLPANSPPTAQPPSEPWDVE